MNPVEEGKELYTNLVSILNERITAKGMSFNELARKSGVDISSVSRIANGKCVPTFPVLYALLKALDSEVKITIW